VNLAGSPCHMYDDTTRHIKHMASQNINGFTASIHGGHAIRGEASNLVAMRHGQQYTVHAQNRHNQRARFTLTIDGKQQGVWILRPRQSATFERPAKVAKKFTFFKEETAEAHAASLSTGASINGVIQCEFIAECSWECDFGDDLYFHTIDEGGWGRFAAPVPQSARHAERCASPCAPSCAPKARRCGGRGGVSLSAGGTGLQGSSGQSFGTTHAITDTDPSTATTICFRLACKERSQAVTPLPGSTGRAVIAAPPPVTTSRPTKQHPKHWGAPPTGKHELCTWVAHNVRMDNMVSGGCAVHRNIACDMCDACTVGIIGERFRLIGADYDLCPAHFVSLPNTQKDLYEVISAPGATPRIYVVRNTQPNLLSPGHVVRADIFPTDGPEPAVVGWEKELRELREMGFLGQDEECKKLLAMNGGDAMNVVKKLIAKERAENAAEKAAAEVAEAEEQQKVVDLVEMGFQEDLALAALVAAAGEVKVAVESLMMAERAQAGA